jgi:hypothetical protein
VDTLTTRRAARTRFALDTAFLLGNVGLAVFGVGLLLRAWQFIVNPQAYGAWSLTWAIGCGLLGVLWLGLFAYALTDYRIKRRQSQSVNPWRNVLLTDFLLAGPTAYYLSVARPSLGGELPFPHGKHVMQVLDVLVAIVSWGPFVALAALPVALLASGSRVAVIVLFAGAAVLVVAVAVMSPYLQALFLWDAMTRTGERPLTLGAWWSIYGLRRYYRSALRPELLQN